MIEAQLHLLSTQQGGRLLPIHSGYRPTFRSHLNPLGSDATVILLGGISLAPGESGNVLIEADSPLKIAGAEDTLKCYEGSRLIGYATTK